MSHVFVLSLSLYVTVCNRCGGLMHTDFLDPSDLSKPDTLLGVDRRQRYYQRWKCTFCPPESADDPSSQEHGSGSVRRVVIPHVLRYLVQELASMKIRVRVKVDDIS